MISPKAERTAKEHAIIILATMACASILPFLVIRILQNDWSMATVDAILVLLCAATAIYVYKTGNTRYPLILIAVLSSVGLSLMINLNGPELLFWSYPIIMSLYYLCRPKTTLGINTMTIISLMPSLYHKMATIPFITLNLTLMVTNIFAFVFASWTLKQQKQLFNLAWLDGLTGVNNRRALDKKLNEVAGAKEPVSLIILDIDNFKLINDQFGHQQGDAVLKDIATIVNQRIRSTDTLYRYGGEEFVIVACDANLQNAVILAEQLRTLVESENLIQDKPLTISLGVAELNEGEDIQDCFARTDKALYQAKESGRNRTCVAPKLA